MNLILYGAELRWCEGINQYNNSVIFCGMIKFLCLFVFMSFLIFFFFFFVFLKICSIFCSFLSDNMRPVEETFEDAGHRVEVSVVVELGEGVDVVQEVLLEGVDVVLNME